MRITRRHAVLFGAIAVWNIVTYANFAANLLRAWSGEEDRPAGYYLAHVVLIGVNTLIAVVLARLAWRTWRADDGAALAGEPQRAGSRP